MGAAEAAAWRERIAIWRRFRAGGQAQSSAESRSEVDKLPLEVSYVKGRRHLPVIELRRAA
jgi:hypothetical protein